LGYADPSKITPLHRWKSALPEDREDGGKTHISEGDGAGAGDKLKS